MISPSCSDGTGIRCPAAVSLISSAREDSGLVIPLRFLRTLDGFVTALVRLKEIHLGHRKMATRREAELSVRSQKLPVFEIRTCRCPQQPSLGEIEPMVEVEGKIQILCTRPLKRPLVLSHIRISETACESPSTLGLWNCPRRIYSRIPASSAVLMAAKTFTTWRPKNTVQVAPATIFRLRTWHHRAVHNELHWKRLRKAYQVAAAQARRGSCEGSTRGSARDLTS